MGQFACTVISYLRLRGKKLAIGSDSWDESDVTWTLDVSSFESILAQEVQM